MDGREPTNGEDTSRADTTKPVAPEVRAAVPADIPTLARALAAAFEDDPIFAWLLPDKRKRFKRLLRFFTLEVGDIIIPTGAAWISPNASGACLELPPNKWRMPIHLQALHAPDFVAVFGLSLPRALITITKMESKHLREPHLYIPYVGVAPESQGQGLGTTLLGRTTERADEQGLPAYLEATSERNAALYERLGFEHVGPFTVLSSPPLWPMRRPPSPAGRR